MRLKVAMVTPGSFVIPSPRSSSVEQVMQSLAEEIGKAADCTLYGIRKNGLPASERRGAVRYIRPSGPKGYVAAVIRSLKRSRYDVIQVDNRPRIARAVKRALPEARVWLALHSLTFVSPRHIGQKELASCFRHADRIIVNSFFLQEELIKLVPEAAPKIAVIYPGVHTERFLSRWSDKEQQWRTARLAELGLSGKQIVLYVGRLVNIKGVHHLLDAMPGIVSSAPDAVLLVVGGAFYGSHRTTVYARALHRKGKRLWRHVRFVPYVPHNRIQDWFRLADVVVVPSPRREAFGLVNVEAMAAGVPVVAAEAGGMKEIIVHGETGLLVPPDRLAEGISASVTGLLSDPARIRYMGEAARSRVCESFTWGQAAQSWLELLVACGGTIG